MREIKFRGTDKYGVWHYGGYVDYLGKPRIVNEVTDGPLYALATEQVIPETLGQYTGLRDKNGVEIYEGDIVDTMALGMFEVIFDCGAFRIAHGCIKFTMIEGSYYEVVGNVHNSPELLKK